MLNKRGISGIVLTIIMVGLTLVAVAVVWTVISGIIEEGVEDIDVSSLKFDLKVERAYIENGNMNVKIKRLSGAGDVENRILIVLSNEDGSQDYTTGEGLKEVQTKTFSFPLEIFNPTKIEVYPVIVKDEKEEIKSIAVDTYEFKDTSLVAYYPFEGNANDESGNGNTGSIEGATPVNGKIGQAYDFDGSNDYIKIPDSDSLDLSHTGTISFWAKVEQWEDSIPSCLLKKGSGAGGWCTNHNDPFNIFDHYNSNFIAFSMCSGEAGAYNSVKISPRPSVGIWHMYTFVWDGSELYSYLDKVLEDTAAQTIDMKIDDSSFWVGWSTSGLFDGSIDEVRIYNRALADFEIEALYNQAS